MSTHQPIIFFVCRYDENKDDFICYDDLKNMMEKRGEPMTHLELKSIISHIDEDKDGKFNFREVVKHERAL